MSLATFQSRRTRSRLPLSYFVPNAGMIQRRRVHDRRQLRGLRTELALLRRIDSLVSSGFFDDYPVNERKYGQADRDELSDIIRSAAHPIVRLMIAVVDREFGSVREEIMMAAVQDEAERIVAEAAESGTNLAAPAEPGFASKPEPASPLKAAADVATPSEPIPDESTGGDTEPTADEAPSTTEAGDEFTVEAVVHDETTDPPSEDATDPAPAAPADPSLADATSPEPEAITPSTDVIKMAEQAVAEIEDGVARLAEALGIETRCHDARPRTTTAETQISDTQTADPTEDHQSMSAIHDEGAEILARIKALHEEIRIARDEADAARQEASSFREDARRAKQRSEASAEAAERSADDAAREAQNARMPNGAAPELEAATASLR